MNPSAHVTNISALADFRAGLCQFVDITKDALVTLDMEVRRIIDWLGDQADSWKAEIRASENAVAEAKTELARRRMMKIGDRKPDTTEQEKLLARATARLEHAQEKYANTRKWLITMPEEIREYEGPSRLLQDSLDIDLPKMIHLLEGKIAALEAYAQMTATPRSEKP